MDFDEKLRKFVTFAKSLFSRFFAKGNEEFSTASNQLKCAKVWKTLWKVCKTLALSGIFPLCSVHRNVENSCQEENCRFFIFCALNNDTPCRTTTFDISRPLSPLTASRSDAPGPRSPAGTILRRGRPLLPRRSCGARRPLRPSRHSCGRATPCIREA